MQVGMIGLGRMGASMVRRLMRGGHSCVVYDVRADAITPLAKDGATGTASFDEFADALTSPRVAWMMVPAAAVDRTIDELSHRFHRGDIIVDGTTPLRNPELYQYDFNLADVAEVWRRGSVIASWLAGRSRFRRSAPFGHALRVRWSPRARASRDCVRTS